MWAANSKAIGAGIPKPFGTQLVPLELDMELQDFMFATLSFCLALVSSLFSILPFLFFGMEYFLCATVSWEYETCFLFYRDSQLRVCLESQRRL
jgi:hypothetical protein